MFQTCNACTKTIKDGQAIVKVEDGSVFNEGEVEYENVEYFHSTCIVVDY